MRIVSYNILDGGEGRADPLAEVIEAQRPDIVGIVEGDDPAVIERIAARLRMDFIQAQGQSRASVLLSRWPIRETINHAALQPEIRNSFLEAKVQTPEFGELSIGVVHLSPHAREADESKRERELKGVLDCFADARQADRPHILLGDFNANSPAQQIDIDRCKEKTREDYRANGGSLPRRVVTKILNAGYIDTLHAVRSEQAKTLGTFSTQFPGQRVDYIFTFAIDRLMDAWIEHDRLAKYASDHFPVGAELT